MSGLPALVLKQNLQGSHILVQLPFKQLDFKSHELGWLPLSQHLYQTDAALPIFVLTVGVVNFNLQGLFLEVTQEVGLLVFLNCEFVREGSIEHFIEILTCLLLRGFLSRQVVLLVELESAVRSVEPNRLRLEHREGKELETEVDTFWHRQTVNLRCGCFEGDELH